MDEILIQDTPEKYRPMAAEIVPPLLALLRERRALEEEIHRRYKTQRQEFLAAGGPPNQLALGEPEGLCKLIFRADDMTLVGAHIMGVQAADLAQQAADLMSRGTTLSHMEDIIFGHPTVSEVLLTACHNLK